MNNSTQLRKLRSSFYLVETKEPFLLNTFKACARIFEMSAVNRCKKDGHSVYQDSASRLPGRCIVCGQLPRRQDRIKSAQAEQYAYLEGRWRRVQSDSTNLPAQKKRKLAMICTLNFGMVALLLVMSTKSSYLQILFEHNLPALLGLQ